VEGLARKREESYQKWNDWPRIGKSIENGCCWNPTPNNKRECWRRRRRSFEVVHCVGIKWIDLAQVKVQVWSVKNAALPPTVTMLYRYNLLT
jgi:hypothetical protein